jgi:formylglycine-generating enzyme
MRFFILTYVLLAAASFSFAQNLPELLKIEGGVFMMGAENGLNVNDAAPIREVTISTFYLSKTPVTVSQWKYYLGKTGKKMPDEPSWGWQDNHPMVNITWTEAIDYCDWLSEQTGHIVRLPTEAEWEFAAQDDGSNKLVEVGWFQNDSLKSTQPVGLKKPNKFGLHDMMGNVWQWCRDWYAWYNTNQKKDPIGPYKGSLRTCRGGSWYNFAETCSIKKRQKCISNTRFDYIGFRVATRKPR